MMGLRHWGRMVNWTAGPVLALLLSSCSEPAQPGRDVAQPSTTSPASAPSATVVPAGPLRDLAVDEAMGGHTLARHVDKTDAELAERLRREPQISAASTYTDRATAERSVGAALADAGGKLSAWEGRTGRRPNLVLQYVDRAKQPLGRSLRRGQRSARPATRALVVLKWNDRSSRFYVLTSYPEADR